MSLARPTAEEHSEYFGKYIGLVTEDDVLALLTAQQDERRALLGELDEARATHRYESGKWSLKEVLGHLIDCERVFAYRALSAARGDTTPLPGFDQDVWMADARWDEPPLGTILDEFEVVRSSSLALLSSLDERQATRRTEIEGSPISVRAIAFILAGHERHHMDVVRTRYL
jgi:uncharacterized damage-inducible protein DinB